MHCAALKRHSTGNRSPARAERVGLLEYYVFGRKPDGGCHAIYLTVAAEDHGHICYAKPRGGRDERVQNWLQIKGRLSDHLEHVTGCGLVFERLLEIACAFAQFAQQPRVLNRDDRLRREALEQSYLLVGKRP